MRTTTKLLSVIAGTCLSTMASAATTIWTPTDGNVNILDFASLVGGNAGLSYELFDNTATDFSTGGIDLALFDVISFEVDDDSGWVATNNAGDSIVLGDTNEFQLTASDGSVTNEVNNANAVADSGAYLVNFLSTSDSVQLLVVDATPSTVPVPATAWLLGSGLIGLVGIARRKSTAAKAA